MRKNIFTPEQKKLLVLLRQIRIEAGLRQSDLARRLQTTQSFVSKYENGERRLDVLELRQVCNALGISLEEFAKRLNNILKDDESGQEKLDASRKYHHMAQSGTIKIDTPSNS